MRLFSSTRRRGRAPAVVAAASMLLSGTGLIAVDIAFAPAANAVTSVGSQDQTLPSGFTNTSPTAQKPESKLWYADNKWWASMAAANGDGFHIWKLSGGNWSDTGIALDPRRNSAADVLWNGFHLFVASHVTAVKSTETQGCPSACTPALLYRFRLSNHTWVRDSGFPVTITKYKTPALTIAQDSLGRLFAAYVRGSAPQIVVSSASADNPSVVFGAEFRPAPVYAGHTTSDPYSRNTTTTTSDDTVAIVAASGYATVVWSNQRVGVEGFYSARHKDGSRYGAGDWTGSVAETGTAIADNHINLKTKPGDSRVFAAVKTSRNDLVPSTGTDPLLQAMAFTPSASKPLTGVWNVATLTTVADAGTRPILALDGSVAHAYWSAPMTVPSVNVRGAIYTKDVSLADLSSPAGRGTIVISQGTSGPTLDDPTSMKSPVTSATGDVVEAFAYTPRQYWHSGSAGSGSSLPSQPVTTLTATPLSGGAGVTVSLNDTTVGTGVNSKRLWDLGDGSAATVQTLTHVYPALGSYVVTLTDYNSAGSTTASVTVNVVAPPVAAFHAVRSTTKALTVNFTDASGGRPDRWTWRFGDGQTSTLRNPIHTYARAGNYAVSLTSTNGAGSSVSTRTLVLRSTVVIVVARAPGRPVLIRVKRLRHHKVYLGFIVPNSNGSRITRYVGYCRSTNGGTAHRTIVRRGPIVVTGLTTGKIYSCRVYAINAKGAGRPSVLVYKFKARR